MSEEREKGSLVDVLNVSKTREEMEELAAQCASMFMENPEAFRDMAAMTLDSNGVGYIMEFPIPGIAKALAVSNQQFFIAGYIKGICHQEETARLERMLKKQ